jgi:hypothetical protein
VAEWNAEMVLQVEHGRCGRAPAADDRRRAARRLGWWRKAGKAVLLRLSGVGAAVTAAAGGEKRVRPGWIRRRRPRGLPEAANVSLPLPLSMEGYG